MWAIRNFPDIMTLLNIFRNWRTRCRTTSGPRSKASRRSSQRRRNAKYSLMDVSIVFSDRLLKEIEKMNAKNCSADVKFLDDIFNSIFRQAGFTFDGGALDDGFNDKKYMFSAGQRLENFFNGVPCWYKDTTTGYLELIVCNAENCEG